MSDEEGKVLTFILGKGGIGKTTTTYNVCSAFSIQEQCDWLYTPGMVIPEAREATELGIDLDPTANLSRSSGIRLKKDAQGKDEPSIHEVLLNPQFGIEYAVKRSRIGYDILPATRSMNNLETELSDASVVGRDFLLDQALRSAEGTPEYPIVTQAMKKRKRAFIDTPRNLGILSVISMVASDFIIVPFQPEFQAYDTLEELDDRVKQVKKIKRSVEIHGIIVTMYDARLELHKEFVKKIRNRYGEKVFRTIIPRNVSLAEAPGFAQSVFEYAPRSAGALAYMELAKEMKERFSL